MTEKFYDVYFDPSELEVDRNGELMNPEALRIIRFDENGSAERVSENGNTIADELPMAEVLNMDHVGFGDDPTIREAMNRFEEWLNEHLVWVLTRRETYWNPAEYICLGIDGYTDEGNPY